LHSSGETTPPCGVPDTLRLTAPCSITPARNSARSNFSSLRSQIRSSTAATNRSCGIASKHEATSVSTTQRRPPQVSSIKTCKASCAERRGRNPNEHSSKSASKIGSIAVFNAACTIRSRTAGIESGRCSDEPGFGMKTRRAGNGR
jgi:hypothetical protein